MVNNENVSLLRLRTLDAAKDRAEVLRILKNAEDYAMIVDGHLPNESAADEFFAAIAPGKSSDEMLKLGIELNHQLIGLVEIARNFPQDGIWHIGLLLLLTTHRGRGIGRYVVNEIEAMAKSAQIRQLMIGIVEENAAAILFWQKLGFKEINRIPNRSFGMKKHTIIEGAVPANARKRYGMVCEKVV